MNNVIWSRRKLHKKIETEIIDFGRINYFWITWLILMCSRSSQ